ncbi:MAG: hypothetical protein OEV40_02855 [Acidimicrobiia bacterium]|nr:hypothetical protein [Acidimicrobiia bacterium]
MGRTLTDRHRRFGFATLLALLLAFAACSSGDGGSGNEADGEEPSDAGTVAVDPDEVATTVGASDDDTGGGQTESVPDDGQPVIDADTPLLETGRVVAADLAGPTAELVTLQDEPYIGAAVYPRPDYEGNPWSQWGQGIALADGRVITAIGDHLGADGNSYLFVYDPEASALTRFADVLSALEHESGSWGYGKVHGQMVDGGDGGIYFSTYWGTRRGLTLDGSYDGDVLFRLDTESLDLQPVVVPVPGFGIPSLAGDGRGRVYGEAVDPFLDPASYPGGGFFVYDVASGEVATFEPDPAHAGFRNVMIGPDGQAFYANEDGGLFTYDPTSGSISVTEIDLGADLRASTSAASDGTIYGVTDRPTFEFFALDQDGQLDILGATPAYTTSLALLPDESGFLFVPGAHGQASEIGAPLIAVDSQTGEQTTLVELAELVSDEFGLVLGGTYSVTVDRERQLAHIGFNAGSQRDPWGEVVFVVVELP